MRVYRRPRRVLALDPISRGFGYVVLELPEQRLVDWGVRHSGRKGPHVRRAVVRLLDVYAPAVVLMETPETGRSVPRRRALQVFLSNLKIAARTRCAIRMVPRTQTADWARAHGANTKKAAVRVLMSLFPELERSAPPERQPWQSEDARHAPFDAVAIALSGTRERHDSGVFMP